MIFPTYAKWPVTVERAEGIYVYTETGTTYIDAVSGIAVCNLGHRHPAVEQALHEQLTKVWHVSNLFHIPLQDEVAAQLAAMSGLDYVFFANSGAEANEAAIKLARKATGKHKIITFEQSFHGRTFATMTATGQAKIHDGFGPLVSEFVYVPYNDSAALLAAVDEETAAIMLEVVQGEGGVVVATQSFIEAVQQAAAQVGALVIVDEVQTGIGRTGKAFGFQHFNGFAPDIITSAKGLGNGVPVGAMMGKKALGDVFTAGVHGSTFGGNPLVLAAVKATLNVIHNDDFYAEVAHKANLFIEALQPLQQHEAVVEVRGLGLMVGIECTEPVGDLIAKLREQKLLVLQAGPNVLRLLPALITTEQQLKHIANLIVEQFSLQYA